MTLEKQAAAIRSREDLVAFLQALNAEFVVRGAEWENSDLASFLEAMAAWAKDMNGYFANRGEDPAKVSPWRVFADILMAARIYE